MKINNGTAPKLCSYTVNIDVGHAPNPFWRYCTLGLCTPNYLGMSESLQKGDWIMGHESVPAGRGLIYAMRISEMLDFDDYFHDNRFEKKKPRRKGADKVRCGDNIYRRVDSGWWQDPSAIHGAEQREKDLAYHKVLVSKDFYYFGKNAEPIPTRFRSLCVGRGCKYRHDQGVVCRFLKWLTDKFPPGVHGNPRDWPLDRISTC